MTGYNHINQQIPKDLLNTEDKYERLSKRLRPRVPIFKVINPRITQLLVINVLFNHKTNKIRLQAHQIPPLLVIAIK